jgi:phage shock protein PspC (stress-responsive transcriptional regulator)
VRPVSQQLVRLVVVALLVLTATFVTIGLGISIMFPNAEGGVGR